MTITTSVVDYCPKNQMNYYFQKYYFLYYNIINIFTLVKKLKYEDFLSELDKLYTARKEKHSVYLTFKRLYQENFKYKRNAKNRKLRMEDRKMQDKSTERFNVLVRAKLQKKRIHTIVQCIL